MYKNTVTHYVTKVLVDIMFYGGIVCVATVPWLTKYLFFLLDKPANSQFYNVGNFVCIGNLCCFHSIEFKTNVSNFARRKSICGKKYFRFSADGCGMRRYFVHFHYKVLFAVFSGNGDHCAGVCNWRVVLPDVKGHFQTGNVL